MKKLFLLLIIFSSCKSKLIDKDLAGRVYNYHIGVVENYLKNSYIDDDSSLNRSIIFLENISKIKSDVIEQRDFFYSPSFKNLKDWKRWYKKNKNKLYWNEIEQRLELK
ncbi:hypothetical protein [Flavobacterium sp. HNIBRBA15423]|uniref:hypothetical protein n=1 Tax=Flavobacterium sp. HNIBRBA15423 TaxID=3458683 RepID=UPI0040445657